MLLKDRIKCFVALGEKLKNLSNEELEKLCFQTGNQNSWFTQTSVKSAIAGIQKFLTEEVLLQWTSDYNLGRVNEKRVGVIAAGNIPLVGFHDVLSVLISGHRLMLKPSSNDDFLIGFIRNELIKIDPRIEDRFEIVERLNDAEAYIATGSDNSARYFSYYFKDKPHVIRANRTSVAVMKGKENEGQLKNLGHDIFQYYGLGCRNVSKIFVPKEYDLKLLLDGLLDFEGVADHHKYVNNYDYNKSIYLVNNEPHLDTGFLLLRESDQLVSPISVLFYEYYRSEDHLSQLLESNAEKIQCIVGEEHIPFGQAQSPEVWDYADGVDTLEFLEKL